MAEIKESPQLITNIARTINDTYSYVNRNVFYATANREFLNYYIQKIRLISEWLDGYVSGFHNVNNGIFSTHLASSLVIGVTNQIFGGKVFFTSTASTNTSNEEIANDLLKIESWNKTSHFQTELKNAIKFSLGLGTSLLKLNVDSKGEAWCEAVRLDSFWFRTNMKGDLEETNCLIRKYVNVLNNSGKENTQENFYLTERRYYQHMKVQQKNAKGVIQWFGIAVPMVVYEVYRMVGDVRQDGASFSAESQKMQFSTLPSWLKRTIRKDYSVIKIGEPIRLPFLTIGAWLFRNDDIDLSIPTIPFGTSLLENILAYLPAWDMCWSYKMRDMYQGKGIIMAPKSFTRGDLGKIGGGLTGNANTAFSGLDESMIFKFDTTDPESQKIDKIQFDLRTTDWQEAEDDILRKIASSIGMTPKTLASYLVDNKLSTKTATEADADTETSLSFIENKREALQPVINAFLKEVSIYLSLTRAVEIKFKAPMQLSEDRIIDRQIKLLSNGLTTPADALKAIYPTENNTQYLDRLNRLDMYLEQQRQKEITQNMQWYATDDGEELKKIHSADDIAFNDFNSKEMIDAGKINELVNKKSKRKNPILS